MASERKPLADLLDSVKPADRSEGLGRILSEGNLPAVAACCRLARDDEVAEIRDAALSTLKRIANRVGDLSADIPKTLADKDAGVRRRCVESIALSQESEHLALLIGRAATEEEPMVRACLAIAIGILGGHEQLELLASLLTDKQAVVRASALEAIDAMCLPDALPHFVRCLRDPEVSVRTRAMRTLRRLGRDRMLAIAEEMSGSNESWRRESAVHLLSTSGVPSAVPLLDRLAKDPVESIREQARKGLESFASQGVVAAAEALAAAPKPTADAWAETVLGEIQAPKAEVRTGPLFDPDPQVRMKGLDLVLKAKKLDQLPVLETLVPSEKDPAVLVKILLVLGRLQSRTSIPLMQAALKHPTADVRRAAIEGLRLINEHQSLTPIKELLLDRVSAVRAWAVIALAVREDVPYLDHLGPFLAAEDEADALLGVLAVEEIKTKRAIELLGATALAKGTSRVREAAEAALRRLAEKKNPTALALVKGLGPPPPGTGDTAGAKSATASSHPGKPGSRPAPPAQDRYAAPPQVPADVTPPLDPRAATIDPSPGVGRPPWLPVPSARVQAILLGCFGTFEIGRATPALLAGGQSKASAVVSLLGLVVASWALAHFGNALKGQDPGSAGRLAMIGICLLFLELLVARPTVTWFLVVVPLMPLLPLLAPDQKR